MKSTRVAFFAVLACIVLLCTQEAFGQDEPCPRACTRQYDPVCGKQGRRSRQFSNACMWKFYNCENTQDVYPEMEEGACPKS